MLFSIAFLTFLTLLSSVTALPARPQKIGLLVNHYASKNTGTKLKKLDIHDKFYSLFILNIIAGAKGKPHRVVPVSETETPGSILWQEFLTEDELRELGSDFPNLNNQYVHVGKVHALPDEIIEENFTIGKPFPSYLQDKLARAGLPERGQVVSDRVYGIKSGRTKSVPYPIIVLEYIPDINQYLGVPFWTGTGTETETMTKTDSLQTYIGEKSITANIEQYVPKFDKRYYFPPSTEVTRFKDGEKFLEVPKEKLIALEGKLPECTPKNLNLSDGVKNRYSEFLGKYCKEKNERSTKRPHPEQGSSGDPGPLKKQRAGEKKEGELEKT